MQKITYVSMGIVIISILVLLFIVLMFSFPGGTGVLH